MREVAENLAVEESTLLQLLTPSKLASLDISQLVTLVDILPPDASADGPLLVGTWSTWSAVGNLTSRAGELRSAPTPAGRMIGIGLRAREP